VELRKPFPRGASRRACHCQHTLAELIHPGRVGYPRARWGEPADVGRAVATIATGRLPFSAGQVIYVDGRLSQGSF